MTALGTNSKKTNRKRDFMADNTTAKKITPELLNKYVECCSLGDVPDWGLAIYAYLKMDGYLKEEKNDGRT